MIHEGDEISDRLARALIIFAVVCVVSLAVWVSGRAAKVLDERAERLAKDELSRKSNVYVLDGRYDR